MKKIKILAESKTPAMTHTELVDWASREIHNGLLSKGSAGLRDALYNILQVHGAWLIETKVFIRNPKR